MNFIKSYLSEILLSVVILLLLGIYGIMGFYYFYEYESYEPQNVLVVDETIQEEVSEDISEKGKMYVDVKGAVQSPGVYEIGYDTIINEVIILAGGFNNNAYTKNINLSKKVNDETVIYVYTKYEYSLLNVPEEKEECICPEPDLSSCINSGSSVIENADTKENISEEENGDSSEMLININTASEESLMTLNGIGEAKAKSIIEYRNTNGLFVAIEDIKKVSGISDNLYEKIKDYIKV